MIGGVSSITYARTTAALRPCGSRLTRSAPAARRDLAYWLLRAHVDGPPVEEQLELARPGDDEGIVEAVGRGRAGVGAGVRVEVEPVNACRDVLVRSTYGEESLPHHVLEAVHLDRLEAVAAAARR